MSNEERQDEIRNTTKSTVKDQEYPFRKESKLLKLRQKKEHFPREEKQDMKKQLRRYYAQMLLTSDSHKSQKSSNTYLYFHISRVCLSCWPEFHPYVLFPHLSLKLVLAHRHSLDHFCFNVIPLSALFSQLYKKKLSNFMITYTSLSLLNILLLNKQCGDTFMRRSCSLLV